MLSSKCLPLFASSLMSLDSDPPNPLPADSLLPCSFVSHQAENQGLSKEEHLKEESPKRLGVVALTCVACLLLLLKTHVGTAQVLNPDSRRNSRKSTKTRQQRNSFVDRKILRK
eukprot:GHVP01025336.1.p1 GENE.GHVP01025336.1~~GHVP01025336.1.p1  ORF type:complete len:114 (-),score=25.76 GHVP01025336.1:71-412(-)